MFYLVSIIYDQQTVYWLAIFYYCTKFLLPYRHRRSGGVTSEGDVSLVSSAWFVHGNAVKLIILLLDSTKSKRGASDDVP